MDFLLTEKPVNAVENDEPESPVKTAGDALKWMSHLKHYFLNKGLTKNYDTTVSLELISSSALTTKQTTITSFFKK